MKVILKKEDYEAIVEHSKKNLPEEACGLIAGVDIGEKRYIKKVYLLENTDHTNEHFTISPQVQLRCLKEIRSLNLKLLGNWHSHPESPSRSSKEDIRLAYDSKMSYLILSLMDGEDLNSFHVENGVSTKEELEIL